MNIETVFLVPLNRSIAAGWLILAVLLLRFLLKKAPKKVRVWLWGLVGVKLVMPVSIKSIFSLIPSAETVTQEFLYEPAAGFQSGVESVDAVLAPVLQAGLTPDHVTSANPAQILCAIAGILWLIGIGVLLLYSVVSYTALRIRLRYAVHLRADIWKYEAGTTPFVLGVLRPRIYLPFSMQESALDHVLAHEYAHIRRGDPVIRLVGWMISCLYWFHPLVWVAYILLCRDIELACDEHVLQTLDEDGRKAYSHALLEQSVGIKRVRPAACPLSFGERDIGRRIRNILQYKKPELWTVVVCAVLCIVVAVCFLTDPYMASDPAKVVGPYDISGLGGDFLQSGNEAYAVGANAYGMPVFEDHRAAYSAFLSEYAAGIEEIRITWELKPISRKNYADYKVYGWQTLCTDEELNRQCHQVTLFFDLYENSFDKTVRTNASPTLPAEMDTDLTQEVSQAQQVLATFPVKNINEMQVYPAQKARQFLPEGAVCTEVSVSGTVLYMDYRYNGYRYIVMYHTDGVVDAVISPVGTWSPEDVPVWYVSSEAPGKVELSYSSEGVYQTMNHILRYTGGEFLGMGIALSYMPEDGSYYEQIILSGDRLTVVSSEGKILYDGTGPTESHYAHSSLLKRLDDWWAGVPEEAIPAYTDSEDMAVYSWYAEEERPVYSIWCFHGVPTWFAEGEMDRVYTLEPFNGNEGA